eukprot:12225924-Karenia_brevis.AAC.1
MRAAPVIAFLGWAGPGNWPPTEPDAFKYLQMQAGSTSPASKAGTFVEALRFCEHVIGFSSLKEVNASLRIQGFAAEQLARLGQRKQAALL